MEATSLHDPEWAARARQLLAEIDARLAERFARSERTDRLLALRARGVDRVLQEAWTRCVPAGAPLALFAVGGYGRGELFPHSDIDLLVLADTGVQQTHHAALARFFALLWDAGLPVSHAVRSPQQCTQACADDQTVLTALIEARALAADDAATARLDDAISTRRIWPPCEFFAAKREEMRQRHARFGDTAENLEPNIKEGPGGLRDLHTLGWMALRTFGVRDLEQLAGLGQLGADEARALARERIALSRLRYGLADAVARSGD